MEPRKISSQISAGRACGSVELDGSAAVPCARDTIGEGQSRSVDGESRVVPLVLIVLMVPLC